jgi:hypothetical protein
VIVEGSCLLDFSRHRISVNRCCFFSSESGLYLHEGKKGCLKLEILLCSFLYSGFALDVEPEAELSKIKVSINKSNS